MPDVPAASAPGAGKRRRLGRLVGGDGRSLLVALDHGAYLGEGPPLGAGLAGIAAAGPDGVLATWGMARAWPQVLAGSGLVLRLDGGASELGPPADGDVGDLLYRAEDAVRLGADAVVVLAFPGAPDEHRSLLRAGRLAAECDLLGLPLVVETIPGGWARPDTWTFDNVARAARIAAELGADLVKTVCPGPPEGFAQVVAACPVPVVALGGPKTAADDVVALAAGVVAAGAAGVAIGRNVWAASDPGGMVRRLHAAVHGGPACG